MLNLLKNEDTVIFLLNKFPMPGTYWMKIKKDPMSRVFQVLNLEEVRSEVIDHHTKPENLIVTIKDVVTDEEIRAPLSDFLDLFYQGKGH